MQTTLADRIKERMEATGITNAELSRACKVKQPTSFNWASGKTKQIKGTPLLLAAKALGVTPEWLATGTGRKFPATSPPGQIPANESVAGYIQPTDLDEWTLAVVAIMKSLKVHQREGALAALRTYVGNLGPPRVGQTLHVAG